RQRGNGGGCCESNLNVASVSRFPSPLWGELGVGVGARGLSARHLLMRGSNSISQIRRVAFNAKDKARGSSRQKPKAEKVKAGHVGNTAPMNRSTAFIQNAALQPAEIEAIPRRPDDRGYSGLPQLQSEDGVPHARRFGFNLSSGRLLGQIEPFPYDVRVGL